MLERMIPHRIADGAWSLGGDAAERVWKLGPLPVFVFRRREDQRWSPHYTRRRMEVGIRIGAHGTDFTGKRVLELAVARYTQIFRKGGGRVRGQA